MMRRFSSAAAGAITILLTLFAGLSLTSVGAAQKTDPQVVSIEDIVVTISGKGDVQPKSLAPGTLCSLRVKLRNTGTQNAYSFVFTVKINGKEETLYNEILYLQAINSGTIGEIALSNFYSPESSKDGKMTVEVTLTKARWVGIKKEGEGDVWTPIGEVTGLPSSKSISILLTT